MTNNYKTGFFVILIILLAGALGFGGYFIYSYSNPKFAIISNTAHLDINDIKPNPEIGGLQLQEVEDFQVGSVGSGKKYRYDRLGETFVVIIRCRQSSQACLENLRRNIETSLYDGGWHGRTNMYGQEIIKHDMYGYVTSAWNNDQFAFYVQTRDAKLNEEFMRNIIQKYARKV